MTRRVVVYPDAAGVAEATAARLLNATIDALALRGVAHVVLTGGTVGIATLAAASRSPLAALVDWTSVHLWWGDERFVEAGSPDRNEGQAQEALLRHIPVPEQNVHRMAASDAADTPEAGAEAYAAELATFGSPSPAFDILMLGLGPDGHVASLFPGHPGAAATGAAAIAVHDSPKPPPTRISLSAETINAARQVWVVAAGAEKAPVVARCLQGDPDLPGASVRGTESTWWLIDAAASTHI